ncbi:hypothetical protein ACF09K_14965 [Streptomyces sp. NPDC014882]|uniref:hypothetical protein n=1 Tax=Streptomyces sp. NPDC014882 TaxID=3364927 RepID=UPI0036FE838A
MVRNVSRAGIISDRRITGLSADVIAELVAELGPLWHERHQAKLASRPRKRALGAGAKHRSVFVDRLLATFVNLRHATTHDVLACWIGYLNNWDIERKTADDFVMDLIDLDDRVVYGCVMEIADSRTRIPVTFEDILDQLERSQLIGAVSMLRAGPNPSA